MKTTSFEIRKGGNVRVKVYVTARTKNGHTYAEYKVCDYVTFPGKRKLWTFADETDARKRPIKSLTRSPMVSQKQAL